APYNSPAFLTGKNQTSSELQKKMLKMKIDPAMCMKTNGKANNIQLFFQVNFGQCARKYEIEANCERKKGIGGLSWLPPEFPNRHLSHAPSRNGENWHRRSTSMGLSSPVVRAGVWVRTKP